MMFGSGGRSPASGDTVPETADAGTAGRTGVSKTTGGNAI
ncbi:MAG: hypothetical protein JWR10_2931 [Rubritepida sp.]|nr:hypothetical protein [Rubritepida sp.]